MALTPLPPLTSATTAAINQALAQGTTTRAPQPRYPETWRDVELQHGRTFDAELPCRISQMRYRLQGSYRDAIAHVNLCVFAGKRPPELIPHLLGQTLRSHIQETIQYGAGGYGAYINERARRLQAAHNGPRVLYSSSSCYGPSSPSFGLSALKIEGSAINYDMDALARIVERAEAEPPGVLSRLRNLLKRKG